MKKLISSLCIVMALGTATTMAQTTTLPQQESVEVSKDELTEFAQVFQQMRMVNQQAQQQMLAVVQEEDLELKRFNAIHEAKSDPNKNIETTEVEDKKYALVIAEFQSIQPEIQKKMENIIKESELSLERYQQLAMALRSNAELQQRLQQIMKS
ncbi:DUF4168 domain-containing protein [Christiangramia aquimixticola]|uniref:DUF4168 domain-containing protein n=1 Tax=Christiangramia aquimixticola TaxID=1697558 RepID=UPI003AA961E7